MKRVVRLVTILAVVLVVAVGALWIRLAPPRLEVPPPSVSLRDVIVVNPGRERREVTRLEVRGGRIAWMGQAGIAPRLGADGSETSAPDTERYAGAFVLPGLIDLRVQPPPNTPLRDAELAAVLFLRLGVTAVRDTGSFDGEVLELRRRIAEGEIPGPRIFTCGPILDGDSPIRPGSRVLRDASEARRAVDDLVASKADCIEVGERLSADALGAIRTAAERHGLHVIAQGRAAEPRGDARRTDVPLPTGTIVPGPSLHQEMWGQVDAGLTPEAAWIAATRDAAKALGQPALGNVRIGAPADLLIFREDPTRDLNALQTLEAVIAAGRLYPRETLEQAVTRWQEHLAHPLHDTVSPWHAGWLATAR